VKQFFIALLKYRVASIASLIAFAVLYSLITGKGFLNKEPPSDDQPKAGAAATDPLAPADHQLFIDGDKKRLRISKIELQDGDLSVFTGLTPSRKSSRQVAKLCEKLIGSQPPLVEVRDFVFVFSRDLEHIRADECDIRHWQK